MRKHLGLTFAILMGCGASVSHADSTIKFEAVVKDGSKTQHTFLVSGRFMRIDRDDQKMPDYSIFDTGRLLLFDINDSAHHFSVTRAGPLFWPSAPAHPTLKPTEKTQIVAGVRCRVVMEMGADGPVAEHCMANTGQLKVNKREMITLSRLFTSARRMLWGWPGVATQDEKMISVMSRDLTGKAKTQSLELKSVAHERLQKVKFKVPDDYKRLMPYKTGLKSEPESAVQKDLQESPKESKDTAKN